MIIFHHLFQTPPTYKATCIDGILQSVMEKKALPSFRQKTEGDLS